MARFYLLTQFHENYGSHAWDGVGACPQRWKRKGSHEYVVEVADAELAAMSDPEVESLLDAMVRKSMVQDGDYVRETVISRGIVPTGCMTSHEKDFAEMFANNVVEEDDRWMYTPVVWTRADLS